jgi:hypothetical protein
MLGYSWGFAAPFDQTVTLDEVETDLVSSHIDTEGLSITIKAPGGLDTYTYETLATEGRDARFRIDVASTSGWGEITMILRASSGEPEWTFGVDPAAQKWSFYRTSAATKELFYWVEPRPYTSLSRARSRPWKCRSLTVTRPFGSTAATSLRHSALPCPKCPRAYSLDSSLASTRTASQATASHSR